jgi:hypothetical protein
MEKCVVIREKGKSMQPKGLEDESWSAMRRVAQSKAATGDTRTLRKSMYKAKFQSAEYVQYALLLCSKLMTESPSEAQTILDKIHGSSNYHLTDGQNAWKLTMLANLEYERDPKKAIDYYRAARELDRIEPDPTTQFILTKSISVLLDKLALFDEAILEWQNLIQYLKSVDGVEDQLMLATKFLSRLCSQAGHEEESRAVKQHWFDDQVDKYLQRDANSFLRLLPEHLSVEADGLTDFFDHAKLNALEFYKNQSILIVQLQKINAEFATASLALRSEMADILTDSKSHKLQDTEAVPYFFFLRSHSTFLTASELAMSGKAPEFYGILRMLLENIFYAFHVSRNLLDSKLWFTRQSFADNDTPEKIAANRRAVGAKFSCKTISRNMKGENNPRLSEISDILMRVYEDAIDNGAHPNVQTFAASVLQRNSAGGRSLSVKYINPYDSESCVKVLINTSQIALELFKIIHPEWIW